MYLCLLAHFPLLSFLSPLPPLSFTNSSFHHPSLPPALFWSHIFPPSPLIHLSLPFFLFSFDLIYTLYQPGLLRYDLCIPQVTNDLLAVCVCLCACKCVYTCTRLGSCFASLYVHVSICSCIGVFVRLNVSSSWITAASEELKVDLWRRVY